MTSVRRTLLVTMLAAIAVVTLVAGFAVQRLARQEVDAILDYHLRQLALSLAEQGRGAVAVGDDEALDFVIQIWAPDGERLFTSRPGAGLPDVAALGFGTVRTRTGAWRVYAAELRGLVVEVAQPLRVRDALAVRAATRTLAPVVLMLPLLAILVWRSVGRALAPLDRVAHDVASRTPAALEALPEGGVPEEALPLVQSLNALLARLGAALAAQRAFVADAAHELRTPLAALRLQAQLVARATDERDRASALRDLEAGLDRVTHVVQQLLTLARADPDAVAARLVDPVPLADLVAQAVADHALLAESRGVDLGASRTHRDAVALGDPAALRTLLANLVENAIRHGRAGGRVDVGAGVDGGRPYLEVVDDGPGIPAAERERVFDRFYRRGGGSGAGSGLGLAIVRAIADRHGATVSLGDAAGGGLSARVVFPPSAAAAAPRP